MKTPTCAHASREEPCWGKVLPTALGLGADTCAGHYYVEATGGRYVAQGERHAFASRIAAMRKPLRDVLDRIHAKKAMRRPRQTLRKIEHPEDCRSVVDLATLADLTED